MRYTNVRLLVGVALVVGSLGAAGACKRESTQAPPPPQVTPIAPQPSATGGGPVGQASPQYPTFTPTPQPSQPTQQMAPSMTPLQQQQPVQQQPMLTQPAQPTWMAPSQPIGGGPTNMMTTNGTLAAGDQTLSSGEFMDPMNINLSAGQPVRIRVHSDAFDPYLIVRTPSGQQIDNDDFAPGTRDAAIDLPGRESGSFRVIVTSYRPGETGAYTLTVEPLSGGMQTQPQQPMPQMQQPMPQMQQPMQQPVQ